MDLFLDFSELRLWNRTTEFFFILTINLFLNIFGEWKI